MANDGVGGDERGDEIDLKSDYDEDDEEEDVEHVKVGARVEEQNVEGNDDDDWLYEGLEGDDFGDDIFATPNSTPQSSAPKSSDAPNTAPESSNAPHIAQNQAMHPMQTLSGLSQLLRRT